MNNHKQERTSEGSSVGNDVPPWNAAYDVPVLIWAADRTGRLTYANRHFEATFGRPASAFLGNRWRGLVVPEDLIKLHAAFRAAGRRSNPFVVEVRLLDISGAVRWHRCQAHPYYDAAGAFTGYSGCTIDVHAALQAEAALRDFNSTLEGRVAERTAQLAIEAAARAAAQERLRHAQKLEALGQLAGGVAHDFNNASAAVLAGIALLEKRYSNVLATAGEGPSRLLRGLRDAAERGVAISRRLLAFARREELRASDFDVAELLHGLRATLASSFWPAVRILVDVPGGMPPIRVDRAQLETTIINLAINARDAMPEGGVVTFGAAVEDFPPVLDDSNNYAPVDVAPGRYVRIWVADTGIGMDEATLAHAAEPFFTTKPRDRGTGLGLSMAHGFAAQSGGAMRIESTLRRGTTVTLWLPCAAPEPAASHKRAAARRALVVEDQPMMRRFLVECLRHEGWEVDDTEDAGRALARLDAGATCDLLVTDLAMPGMDGAALIQAARDRRPNLAALMLTGTGRMADMAPVAARNRFALLRKPVSPAELAECVASLVPALAAPR